jgi:Holliday junction resolvase RusA-like endonuclease
MIFTIPGEPVPKLRARIVQRGGKAWGYPPQKSKEYADYVKLLVKNMWQHGMIRTIPKPKRVKVAFRFFVSSKPTSKPDIINLAAQLADCLSYCYDDDSQITHITCRKLKSTKPRVVISVEEDK